MGGGSGKIQESEILAEGLRNRECGMQCLAKQKAELQQNDESTVYNVSHECLFNVATWPALLCIES